MSTEQEKNIALENINTPVTSKVLRSRTFIVSLIALLGVILTLIFKDKEKLEKIEGDLKNPQFLFFLILIILLIIFGYFNKSARIRKATFHATIAFLVAYLAHLDMVFVAFFLVGFVTYFIGDV